MKPRQEIKAGAREALRAHRGTSIGLVLAPLMIALACMLVFYAVSIPTGLLIPDPNAAQGFVMTDNSVGWHYNWIANPERGAAPMLVMLPVLVLFFLFGPALMVTVEGGFTQLYRRDDVTLGGILRRWFQRWKKKTLTVVLVAWFTYWWTVLFMLPALVFTVIAQTNAHMGTGALYALASAVSAVSLVSSIALAILMMRYALASYITAEYPGVSAREAVRLSVRMTKGHRVELFFVGLSFIGWMLLSVLTLMVLGVVYVIPYIQTTMAGYYVELRDLALTSGTVTAAELGDSSYVGGNET